MSMSPTLTTRADLDQLRCDECNDGDGLYLACTEHPDTLSLPFYKGGELRLECPECGTVYLTVPIAG
jgi:hypothetical protein